MTMDTSNSRETLMAMEIFIQDQETSRLKNGLTREDLISGKTQEGDINSQDDIELSEGQIVGIDHLAPLFKSLQEDLQGSLTHVKANNEFIATAGAQGARCISEVESGMHLLKSEQVDVNLVERLILRPLRWILAKIGDEAISMIIGTTISALVAWLASKGMSIS